MLAKNALNCVMKKTRELVVFIFFGQPAFITKMIFNLIFLDNILAPGKWPHRERERIP